MPTELTGCMVADCIAQDKTLEERPWSSSSSTAPCLPRRFMRPSTCTVPARTARHGGPRRQCPAPNSGRHWEQLAAWEEATHQRAGIHRRLRPPACASPTGRRRADNPAATCRTAQAADRPGRRHRTADLAFLCRMRRSGRLPAVCGCKGAGQHCAGLGLLGSGAAESSASDSLPVAVPAATPAASSLWHGPWWSWDGRRRGIPSAAPAYPV